MSLITSRDNPTFRQLLRLAAGREGAGTVLLEGRHLCEAWMAACGMPEKAIFDAERLERDDALQALAARASAAEQILLAPRLLRRLSAVAGHQGVCFAVRPGVLECPRRIDHACLWLDRVQDPGNVGTLLRIAAAAGLRHVYLSRGCARVWSDKALRSGQGAQFILAMYEGQNLEELVERLDVPLLATALDGGESLYARPLPAACAWLMGNEGQGVCPRLLQKAHRRLFIPHDPAVDSLNVAGAAAVCLFEQRRQHCTVRQAQ